MADVVLLDRIEPGNTPAYCIHGRATCVLCQEWCWVGSQTIKALESGAAQPLCLECARRTIPPEMAGVPRERIIDHLRKDGPHED